MLHTRWHFVEDCFRCRWSVILCVKAFCQDGSHDVTFDVHVHPAIAA